ncbi:MAG: prepilin-type N-terminal cleavage/methylation domain-containing protein [Sulfuricurvum sp.]|uniref:type II secretion system protein n=1 Tax=Sulfuricurvum sp. TaxID=2025608 RepID=UPI003561ED3B
MRNAFSLIELIFVIVLIGVLSGIGFYLSRPDYARQDAQYTLLMLKEARYRALGFDAYDPSGCVTLTPSALSNNTTPTHTIKSTITIDYPTNPNITTLCFDGLGRPHEGNSITLNTLIQTDINITFRNSDKNSTIRLFNGTGYAIIPCNN